MYRIGQLARHVGASPDTLRFYERKGLVHPVARSEGGHRLYGEEALHRLNFINQAQALGLTLEEIRAMLRVMEEGRPPCADVRRVLRQKVSLLERRIAELTALRAALTERLRWAEAHPDPLCEGHDHCVYLDSTPT